RHAAGKELIELPDALAVGDFVNHVTDEMKKDECRGTKYTFSGSVYFERMKECGLYLCDPTEIAKKVETTGRCGLFAEKIC
ncbi:MAG: FAD-dependent oxidoreductase, partial [Cloacibacillus sp.]|nr:FAD-dependent oxidoreductase [Cloacibacillus sp.]